MSLEARASSSSEIRLISLLDPTVYEDQQKSNMKNVENEPNSNLQKNKRLEMCKERGKTSDSERTQNFFERIVFLALFENDEKINPFFSTRDNSQTKRGENFYRFWKIAVRSRFRKDRRLDRQDHRKTQRHRRN